MSENRSPKELSPEGGEFENRSDRTRVVVLGSVFLGGLLLLLVRVVWLAGFHGAEYRSMADGNRIREEVVRAPRGLVLDRLGQKLTQNVPIFRVEERDKNGNLLGYQNIGRDEALGREAQGLSVLADPGRQYPLSMSEAHVVGYVNEAGPEELKKTGDCGGKNLEMGDFVGRGGIEEGYDCLLRGVNGRRILETDTAGKVVRVLGQKQPITGRDLTTTLDARLLQVATSALGGKDGAVVVLEATTGAVLAIVSSPSYDPNLFSMPKKGSNIEVGRILTNPGFPLLNRALGGAYPAGSVFKLAVASAALEEKNISSEFTIDDPGVISAGGLSFSNWFYSEYGRKEGVVDVVRALTRSTDTFFYEVGALTGPDNMASWANKMGLGKATGIDIPGEVEGLIPTPSWKIKTKGEQWYLGNTYNMSIGQGDVLVTPLQVAQMTQVVANGGKLCKIHVVGGKKSCTQIGISGTVLELIKKGMVGACSPGGTAFPLFNFKPQVACKTGTAQFGIEGKLTHAWLTAFAPVERPEIVVTALVEGGGEGSAVAAPVAKAVLEEWFRK